MTEDRLMISLLQRDACNWSAGILLGIYQLERLDDLKPITRLAIEQQIGLRDTLATNQSHASYLNSFGWRNK